MHHHVVTFRFKPGVTESDVDKLAAELRALAATLPGLRSYSCGPDLRLREGNADFAVAAVFDTEDALLNYLNDPTHKDIIARYVSVMVAERHGAQFTAHG